MSIALFIKQQSEINQLQIDAVDTQKMLLDRDTPKKANKIDTPAPKEAPHTEEETSLDAFGGDLTYETYKKCITTEWQNAERDGIGFIINPIPSVPMPENFQDQENFEKAIQLYKKILCKEGQNVQELLDQIHIDGN